MAARISEFRKMHETMMITAPRRILLATDLSARSDRAHDRALSMAELYGSELIILHVLESFSGSRPARLMRLLPFHGHNEMRIASARRRLLHDLGDMSPERVSVLIEKGDPAETIMTVARERNCDLLVTGVARNEILGRFTMGRTVDRLIGKWDRNLLVVTEKAMAPYSRVVVLTDLSETSKRAVEAAVSLFPDRMIDILYAYSAARSSSVENSESYVWQVRDLATRELSDFLASLGISRKQRSMINMVVEHGTEARVLEEYLQLSEADLVVVGSRLRGFFSRVLRRGRTIRIIPHLSCDALVIRSSAY